VKFRYRKFAFNTPSDFLGKSILKPIIPIKISRLDTTIQYLALIDSGADFCIFDAEVGEYLKLNVKSGVMIEFGGIQSIGGAKAYIHRINLDLGGYNFITDVGFSYDISKSGHGILGQKGFFDKFSIKFDLQKEDIEINPK